MYSQLQNVKVVEISQLFLQAFFSHNSDVYWCRAQIIIIKFSYSINFKTDNEKEHHPYISTNSKSLTRQSLIGLTWNVLYLEPQNVLKNVRSDTWTREVFNM